MIGSAPRPGAVISYNYLWHREHLAGQDEGRKTRPCVVVVAVRQDSDGTDLVRVVPVTHSPPAPGQAALELPAPVKRSIGLDEARSWIVLDEINEFTWPGFDLRPIAPSRNRFVYGLLPPRLFAQLVAELRNAWTENRGRRVPRF